MKAVKIRKWILYSLITLSMASWAGFFVTFTYFHDGHLPSVPQESTGHIYESNSHGHMAYLTTYEHDWLIALQVAAMTLFVLGIILNKRWHVYVHPLEGMTHQQRYNILQGRPKNKDWDD
jgi:glucan phosphoethanolaminetransferase (alkaline phosphatase superfamily)